MSAAQVPAPVRFVRDLVGMAADVFDIGENAIFADRRDAVATRPRHAVMLLARDGLQLSSGVIGRALARDHTTILDAVRTARRRMAREADYRAQVLKLAERAGITLHHPKEAAHGQAEA